VVAVTAVRTKGRCAVYRHGFARPSSPCRTRTHTTGQAMIKHDSRTDRAYRRSSPSAASSLCRTHAHRTHTTGQVVSATTGTDRACAAYRQLSSASSALCRTARTRTRTHAQQVSGQRGWTGRAQLSTVVAFRCLFRPLPALHARTVRSSGFMTAVQDKDVAYRRSSASLSSA
jgi:hypothetical protein